MEISRVINIDKTYVHGNGQGQKSDAKVIEVKNILPQFGHFRTMPKF